MVREELEKSKDSKAEKLKSSLLEDKFLIETKNAALQELYEFTQRKFLRQITKLNDKNPGIMPIPRLLFLDLVEIFQIDSEAETSEGLAKESNSTQNKDERRPKRLIKQKTSDDESIELVQCIRVMCEHEEGWHPVPLFVPISELNHIFSSYLARIMNILKHGNLKNELKIFLADDGQKTLNEIEKNALQEAKTGDLDLKIDQSYSALRSYFTQKINEKIKTDEKSQGNDIGTLQRCELKNGKTLWLCPIHLKLTDAKIISNKEETSSSYSRTEEFSMIDAIEAIKDEQILDEPTIKIKEKKSSSRQKK